MNQMRLNKWLLNIHSDKTDSLNLSSIANEFVGQREGRLRVFGKFNVKIFFTLCDLILQY